MTVSYTLSSNKEIPVNYLSESCFPIVEAPDYMTKDE